MGRYHLSEEEKKYLAMYDLSDYERPSVTADIAVFAVMDELPEFPAVKRKENYRKDPKRELQVLLVKRGSHPFQNCWALPGGFGVRGESCDETALRELREETGVEDAYLRPFDVFSDPERDPRGWIISHGYLALIDGGKYRLRAGTDAWEAAWFRMEVTSREFSGGRMEAELEEGNEECKAVMLTETLHELSFYQRERDLVIKARVLERKCFSGLHAHSEFEILESGGLAFDHAMILLKAHQTLRREAESTGRIVFDLMPERFTLNRLQRAFELVLGRDLLTANFRRKMAPLVIETGDEVAGVGHRPAKLFRRNPEEF